MYDWEKAKINIYGCSSDKQQLDVVLENIYFENNLEEEESFPLFVGKYVDDYCSTGKPMIVDIKSALGTDLYNPYCLDNSTKLSAITKRNTHIDGERLLFIPEVGHLRRKYDLLKLEDKFWSFSELGIDNDAKPKDWLNAVLSEQTDYSDKIRDLLAYYYSLEEKQSRLDKLQAEIEEYQQTLENIKKKISEKEKEDQNYQKLKIHIQKEFPEGLDKAEEQVNDLRKNRNALNTEIDKLKSDRDNFKKQSEEYQQSLPEGETFSSAMKKLEEYNAKKEKMDELRTLQHTLMWFTGPYGISTNQTPKKESIIHLDELRERLPYVYSDDLLVQFLMALSTDQITILFGKPGTGKTSFVSNISKALGAKFTLVPVQSNWTDVSDILGYYNPINKTYISTPLLEALLKAKKEFNRDGLDANLYIICLDEMNLARVEYYFAEFLSILQREPAERKIRILPPYIEEELLEKCPSEEKMKKLSKEDQYLIALKKYFSFQLPPNVRFVGTINNDDTTNDLSPKVKDRSFFIEMEATNNKYSEKRDIPNIADYYPLSFFIPDDSTNPEMPGIFVNNNENGRFIQYAVEMYNFYRKKLSLNGINEFVQYLIIAKILPSIKKKDEFKPAYNRMPYRNAQERFALRATENSDYYNYLGVD